MIFIIDIMFITIILNAMTAIGAILSLMTTVPLVS